MNTQKTYATHLRAYLKFCDKLCIAPVPVDEHTVALYATYLGRTLKPSSVRQYINIVRLLHLECGLGHPFKDSWVVKSTIRGMQRCKGCAVNRKAPVTPEILLSLKSKLSPNSKKDCVFWATCLLLFFGLLRKANVLHDTRFDPGKQLCRRNFVVGTDGELTVLVHWTKTIQFRERALRIRLPRLAPSDLCPVSAVVRAFQFDPSARPDSQALPLRAADFNARLKKLAGPDISSHSFRRGGATHALSVGIPGEIIKVWGDWKSNAYLAYLDQIPQPVMDHYRTVFATSLTQAPTVD